MLFINRKDAGHKLAQLLYPYKNSVDTIVMALPRGGVPVAAEIAQEINLPLDVILVRKLGIPGQEELAMGAIANDNVRILNKRIIEQFGISDEIIDMVAAKEAKELKRRNYVYRQGRIFPKIEAKTVILVDDGCATGANMLAAIRAVAQLHAGRIIAAAPVMSSSAYRALMFDADDVACVYIPDTFNSVGEFYQDFHQVTDQEVKSILRKFNTGKL